MKKLIYLFAEKSGTRIESVFICPIREIGIIKKAIIKITCFILSDFSTKI